MEESSRWWREKRRQTEKRIHTQIEHMFNIWKSIFFFSYYHFSAGQLLIRCERFKVSFKIVAVHIVSSTFNNDFDLFYSCYMNCHEQWLFTFIFDRKKSMARHRCCNNLHILFKLDHASHNTQPSIKQLLK